MANNTTLQSSPRRKTSSRSSLSSILICGFCSIASFYLGLFMGSASTTSNSSNSEPMMMMSREECKNLLKEQLLRGPSFKEEQEQHDYNNNHQQQQHQSTPTNHRFPSEVSDFLVGMSRVPRDDFAQTFDLGVPWDESTVHNHQVMLLYQTTASLPESMVAAATDQEVMGNSNSDVPLLSVSDATLNCDTMAIALLQHAQFNPRQKTKPKQCLALVGQYESWHLQKYMRLPKLTKLQLPLNSSWPLRYVNRGAQPSGRIGNTAPTMETTRVYWDILQRYLASLEANIAALQSIVQKIATQNTIVVLVCNFGQSELLANFVCHAKTRSLNISSVLVFATDQETYDLATSLGLTAYYDHSNYESMPKEAAKRYADRNFRSMMMAKVFCVHMIVSMGYNVLFQDVDVVWFRHPLEYFHNNDDVEQFDMYFQDDGNHALYYAPYSANTGFYYVKNNLITQHFFNTFLMAGDTIIATKSHQVALIALLGEHASLYGLKVKVFNRNSDEFPGGHAFNQRKPYMKDFFAHVVKPYIMHMSWTISKINKQKYFQQMGEWYYEPTCIQKTSQEILAGDSSGSVVDKCCALEPIIVCHYRDKPSIKPCRESPPIDAGQRSWW